MTTAEMLIDELEKAAEDLMKYGEHDGACTNAAQMAIAPKVRPCAKHESAQRAREKRFRDALDQFKVLRDVLGTQSGI